MTLGKDHAERLKDRICARGDVALIIFKGNPDKEDQFNDLWKETRHDECRQALDRRMLAVAQTKPIGPLHPKDLDARREEEAGGSTLSELVPTPKL